MAFPTGWGRKCKITIPDAQIQGSNTDFPVLLTAANFPGEMLDGGANSALNGGGDVRFSEDSAGAVRLACDIVSFVTGGTPEAQIRVKLPTLNTGAAKEFYVWYEKSGEVQPLVTAAFGRDAVYAQEKSRWHLSEAGAAEINIEGSSGFDGTKSGIVVQDSTNKIFGSSSDDFNNDGHYDLTNDPFIGLGAFTFRGWIRNPGTTSEGIFSNWVDNADMSIIIFTGSNDKLFVRIMTSASGVNTSLNSSTLIQAQSGTPWHYICVRYDGSNIYLDVDGINEASAALTGSVATPSVDNPEIGRYASSNVWSGNIQEMSVADSHLGLDWCVTEYNNQIDPAAFASAGVPETVGGGLTLTIQSAANNHIADNIALSQFHSLTVNEADHSHGADSPVLFQGQILSISGIVHGMNNDVSALTQTHMLMSISAGHGLSSDNMLLGSGNSLLISAGTHSTLSDDAILQQIQALILQNINHGLTSDAVGLFDPTAFSPSPGRLCRAGAHNRNISLAPDHRNNQPTNH